MGFLASEAVNSKRNNAINDKVKQNIKQILNAYIKITKLKTLI